MESLSLRKASIIGALLVVLAVNGLANTLPLNGQTTGEISDRFEVFFVPAAYVFSIWGLIYLGLIAYAAYQARGSSGRDPDIRGIDGLFVLSCAANVAWLFFWHYEVFWASVVAMLVLLGSLIAIYLRLDIGRRQVSTGRQWFVHVPFSIYLGWITVATIANITVFLDSLGWSGWGLSEPTWAAVMLVIATAIAAVMAFTRRDVAYLLVLVWAFIGIAVRFPGEPTVSLTAWAMTGVVAALAVYAWLAAEGRLARGVQAR